MFEGAERSWSFLRGSLSFILSFIPTGWIFDFGLWLVANGLVRIINKLIFSIAVLVRRDEHTLDTEEWLDRNIYHIGPDKDEEDAASEPYDEDDEDEDDEEETGDEEYLQYGHVDDME